MRVSLGPILISFWPWTWALLMSLRAIIVDVHFCSLTRARSLGYLKIHYMMCWLEHILTDGYTESWVHSLLCHWDSVIDDLSVGDPGPHLLIFFPPLQNGGDSGRSQTHGSIERMDRFARPIKLSWVPLRKARLLWSLREFPFPYNQSEIVLYLISYTLYIGHLPRICKISHIN